jgi:hypothetical protein
MNTESQSSQPASPSQTLPRQRATGCVDRLKEPQKLPAIILQPETKSWTLVPITFPEFNDFYRL